MILFWKGGWGHKPMLLNWSYLPFVKVTVDFLRENPSLFPCADLI